MSGPNVDLLRTAGEFFGKTNTESNVRVVGFAKDALYGITAAINEQSRQVSDLSDSLDDANRTIEELRKGLGSTAEQERKDEKAKEQREAVASQAAERNTRARNLALTGEIKKATSALDVLKNTLKDAIDKMTGMLKESIKSSLRNFDDFSKDMRAANISHADKIAAQAAASAAKTVSGGAAVSMSSIHSAMKDLYSVNKAEFDRLAKSKDADDQLRLNTLGLLKDKTKLSAEEINKLSASFGKGQEKEFQKLALQMASANGGEGVQQYVKKMVGTKEGQIALAKGDASKILLENAESAQKLAYYGFGEAAAKFSETATKIKEGMIEGVDTEAYQQMIAITGKNAADPMEMATAIEDRLKGIAGIKDEEERKRAGEEFIQQLRPLEDKVGGITDMITLVQKAQGGTFEEAPKFDADQEMQNVLDNSQNGKLKHYTEKAMAGINNITGNLLGKLSVNLDELFGGDLSMENVVSQGFMTVVNLLRSIRLSMLASGLKNAVGFFKEKFFKSKEKEKKSDAKLVSDPIVDSSEKNTKSIVKAIKKLGTQLSGKNKLGKASGDASSNGDSKSKKKTVSSEASSKSSSKSQKQTTKKAPSKSSKALLGVGLGLGGIGAVAGVAGLLGSMGVFDSLKPMFEDFSKSVVPTIKTAVDTLAPTIDGILKQVAPVINDLLKSFGPVLKDVLDSLMPLAKDLMGFLINILNPLLPVVKNIFDALIPLFDDLLSDLVPIVTDLFNDLMPLFNDVISDITPVLRDIFNTFGPLFKAITPIVKPLVEMSIKLNPFLNSLKLVGMGVSVISKKFGLDMDREREKERQEAFKNEKARSDKSRERGDMLSKYSHDELIKIATSLASSNTNDEMYSDVLKSLQNGESYTNEQLVNFIRTNTSGTNGESRILTDEEFNSLVNRSVNTNKTLEDIQRTVEKSSKQDKDFQNWQKTNEEQKNLAEDSISLFENGGVTDKPTKAIVGEAGREVIFPLTKPDKLREVLLQLSSNEKLLLLKSLLKSDHSLSILEWSDILYNILSTSNKRVPTKNSSGSMTSSIPYSGDSYESAVKALESYRGGRLKPAEFVKLFGPIAREDMRRSGIPASVTLAQAALETGWGKTAHADFRNLFGIKGSGDAGSKVVNTHEVYDGVSVKKKDAFAQYSSYLASIEAHSKYLLNAKRKSGLNGLRYGEALTHIFEPNLFAYLLREGGYATSTSYGAKLVGLMRSNDLYKYDLPVGSLALQDVGPVQRELISLAENNALNSASSQERLNALREEEYQREVIRAIKENKAPPSRKSFMSVFGSGATPDLASTSAPPVADVPSISKVGLLSTSDIQSIMHEAGINNASSVAQYVEQANRLLGSTASKEDIMMVLYEIARYLKGIYSSPANRQPIVPVARPNEYTYGVSGSAR